MSRQSERPMTEAQRKPGRQRLLAMYAHPDDETFCAGGALAKYAAAGVEIMVVSMTRGEAGQIRDAGAATRRALGETRALELRRACRHLGVEHVMCLDYGDGKLATLNPMTLTARTTAIIRAFRPDVVLTFGDDGVYGHPDHIAIGDATDRAFRLASDPSQFPEQRAAGLAPHAPAQLYHCYIPRSPRLLLDDLVTWLKSLKTRFCGALNFVRGLVALAESAAILGYSSDDVRIACYPPGAYILKQGDPAVSLYLMLSGRAEVMRNAPGGGLRAIAAIGPGSFFGEDGLAAKQPRNAHIIARDGVSCLVLSPGAPAPWSGNAGVDPGLNTPATTCIDVSDYVPQKVAAMAAHRTQCPIETDMLPEPILRGLFACEYFVRVHPRTEAGNGLSSSFW